MAAILVISPSPLNLLQCYDMCDADQQKREAGSDNKCTSSAELSPMNVNDFTSFITAMMTDLKTEILSQVNDSIAQVYS